ncbi:thioredoxin family protein [Virgibacillus natechei]|uniref:thioredoxin family protein n=1 Tax=Virgibacillus sp. CBA3643 TaxID=2942278 RepID=UPI0035A39C02
MKKKLFIFGGIIIVLFIALFLVTSYQNNQTVDNADNPYGTTDLEQGTIDQLDDPDYDNQVMPDELSETMENGDAVTVYFYDPTCVHCQQTTPYLAPLAEDMGVDMKKFNLLEFGQQSMPYAIESTPTLIHYENGEEVARLVGQHPEEEYESFFDQYVLN